MMGDPACENYYVFSIYGWLHLARHATCTVEWLATTNAEGVEQYWEYFRDY